MMDKISEAKSFFFKRSWSSSEKSLTPALVVENSLGHCERVTPESEEEVREWETFQRARSQLHSNK